MSVARGGPVVVRLSQWHRVVWAIAIALGLAAFSIPGQAAAATAGTFRLDPSSTSVDQGATFTVHVIQNSSIATSGAQVTLLFDASKLQIQSVVRGQAYANSPIFVPSDMSGDIATANSSGKLYLVATAFLPPTAVAAGDQDFIDVTFKATGCGLASLSLPIGKTAAQILDGTEANYGQTINVTTSGGTVTIGNCTSDGGSQQASGATAGSQATVGSQATASAGDQSASGSNGDSSAASNAPAGAQSVGGGAGNQGGLNYSPASGSSDSGGSLPLWIPILAAIPAVALLWLGLRKWRLESTSSTASRRSW